MEQKICVINSTVKLFYRPLMPVILVRRPKMPLTSTYCTKSAMDKRNEYLIQHMSKTPSGEHGFNLKSAKHGLQDAFFGSQRKNSENSSRISELNIQMLSRALHEHIFGHATRDIKTKNNKYLIARAKNELKKHGLWTEEVNAVPDVSMKLPKLNGKNIEEHFWNIGQEQSGPYKTLMCDFVKRGIPEIPKEWVCRKGWTKYKAGEEPLSVPFPNEDAMVFDVEVSVKTGEAPVMAVAVSSDCWYGWVSSSLTEEIEPVGSNHYSTDMLIPLEGNDRDRCRIVVGHNVSYDRARIKEQYYMESSALRFMDTMSLHICIGGASKLQKSLWKTEAEDDDEKAIYKKFCLTSLQDLYSLYCNSELSKEERQIFVQGSLADVRANFQDLISYCASDVKATYEVFQILLPIYLERFPHPVTLAGMLEMGMAYLTVNQNWDKYLKLSQEKFDDLESEMSFLLAKKCDDACRLLHNEQYKNDLWLWNEDWSTQELKMTKKTVRKAPDPPETAAEEEDDPEIQELMKKFQYLFDMESVLPVVRPLLPGYPAWYRKLCRRPESQDWTPGPHCLHTSLAIAPKILNLTYENYPLHYLREHGWGILVADLRAKPKETSLPFTKLREVAINNNQKDTTEKISEDDQLNPMQKKVKSRVSHYNGTALWCDQKIDDCCYFLKLPHKDGDNKNVGQPLSKSFTSVFLSNLLAGSDSVSQKGLMVSNILSYWRNNRQRITSQMVVWLKPEEVNGRKNKMDPVGVIIPKIVVCGTLTRRAVEPTWLTASNSAEDRLGSELRSMIQAPPGYHFVGADVDSQELWIASLIGDSKFSKVHGGTPFGWMTISGSKLKGTDLHSVTAKAAGISREHAKVINYARIYGAGVKFAEKLLQQFNPSMSPSDVKAKARKMYSLTKGTQSFKLKRQFVQELKIQFDQNIAFRSVYSAMNFAKKFGKAADAIFEYRKWEGGTESAVFNELEKIASSPKPETPFLQSRLSRVLEPRFDGDDLHMNTRINWVVQSGAVDFLHLMLVCMRWLTNGRVRFSLSFHDEVRYLVPSEYRYQAALALQMTNLLTRSFFAHRMGLYDLPLSVAFFSSVEIDTSMRKGADDDCVTPSNPHGLEKGYGVPKGESLTIYDTLAKSGGDISVFKKMT